MEKEEMSGNSFQSKNRDVTGRAGKKSLETRQQKQVRTNEEQIPINRCRDTDDVQAYFTQRLVGQESVFAMLAPLLWRLHRKSTIEESLRDGGNEPPRDRINLLLLSGPSTTGKTETCDQIARLFGLKGTKKLVYFDLATIVDESQVNQLLGAGPGLVGSDGNNSLPFMLLEAIGCPHVEVPTGSEKLKGNGRRTYRQETSAPPPLVLVHMDELDKAHPKILTPLLNFVDTGVLRASNGVAFTLPERTHLLFLFSANYAADVIRLKASNEFKDAVACIKMEMKTQGILDPVINRFHHILPFFSLSAEEKNSLADKKILESMAQLHKENDRFFADIACNERIERLLCEVIKAEATDESGEIGLRQLHLTTEIKLGELIQRAISAIENAPADHFTSPLQHNLVYYSRRVPREDFPKLQRLVTLVPKLVPPLDRKKITSDLATTSSDDITLICIDDRPPEGQWRPLSAMLATNYRASTNATSVGQPALQLEDKHLRGPLQRNKKTKRSVNNAGKECDRCGEVRPREEFPQYKKSKQLSDDSTKEYTCYRGGVCTVCKQACK
jgi:hypothetical protein